MKGLFACVILYLSLVYAAPTPPTSFPPVWHSWILTSVKVVNQENPVFAVGQNVYFYTDTKQSCRYNEQNLVNTTIYRPVDLCDYGYGYHWRVNDTATPGVGCAKSTKISGASLDVITYPAQFVNTAKFLGIDPVGQLNCSHFYSPSINLGGTPVQVDIWTDVVTSYPCQISTFDSAAKVITTWAFDGFTKTIPSHALSTCSVPKLVCAESNWVCHAKPSADVGKLAAAISWVCSAGLVDCTPINPGGAHFEPDTIYAHCDWAFDQYYQANKDIQGVAACDFSGSAELVPPSSPPQKRANRPNLFKFLSSMTNAGPGLILDYDVVCPY